MKSFKFFEKYRLVIFLLAILAIAFLPLAFGYNFLPFDRYTSHSCSITEGSTGRLQKTSSFLELYPKYPWLHEREPAALSQCIPEDQFASHELKRGRLPLWDPYPGGGMPTFDAGQFRPFNIFRWIYYIWPTSWTYSLSLLLLVVAAAAGVVVFLRALGLSEIAACLGVMAYVLNPWVLWTLALGDAGAYLAFPWVLWAIARLRQHDQKSAAGAALALVAMGNIGHVTVCLILAGAAAALFLFGNMSHDEGAKDRSERARALGFVALLSLLGLALLWLPMVGFVEQSFSYKALRVAVQFPYRWRAFLSPAADLFLLPSFAVFIAASAWVWRRSKAWWMTAGLTALCFLPIPGLGEKVPDFFFKYLGIMPAYLKPLLWVCLSVLVAIGADAAPKLSARARAIAFGFGALFMAAVIALQLMTPELSKLSPPLAPLWLLLALSLLAAWLLASQAEKKEAAWLLAGLVVLPLAYPLAGNVLPWNQKRLGGNPFLESIAKEYPHDRVASVFSREVGWALPSNQGSFFGIRAIEINSPFFLNRYFSLFSDTKHFPTWIYFDKLNPLAFRQAGASIVLLPNEEVPSDYPVLLKGAAFSACAIPNASGRAYFARLVGVNDPTKEMSKQILALGNGADDVALIEPMGYALPPVLPEVPAGKAQVRFLLDEPTEVVLQASSTTPGFLVLKDSWYPSWKAAVDGAPTSIYRVNGCFRGVLVPGGEHEVRFFYRPTTVYLAGVISGIGLLVILLLIGVGKRSGQNREPSPKESV
jgi:hypothetical protein